MGEISTKRRYLPRFTLRSLLAFVVILLLGISHWNTSRQLDRTRAELAALRRETGELVIRDPTKLHFVAQRTMRSNCWQWRVHIPEGSQYSLELSLNELVETQRGETTDENFWLPGWDGHRKFLTPGTWTVTYEFATRPLTQPTDSWAFVMEASGGASFRGVGSIPLARIPWMNLTSTRDYSVRLTSPRGGIRTESFATSEDATLLELRVGSSSLGGREINGVEPQMLLKLVPAPVIDRRDREVASGQE